MINIEELKKEIEELGYIATEELIYDAFNAICMFSDSNINPGQDIYALCLEGPPGAGKTEFAKIYTKLAGNIFGGNVEMVDYQCDATTGKTELFEDINISAAIRGDADNVNIPGKLIDAIKKVNSGKRVVLFIDEYDKAREETDAFLLQFLQSGKINSTQHGDLEIKQEFKQNLQVILCKNDMREELSGPLSRRLRFIRLDYMEPETFYQVAHRNLVDEREDKVSDGLLNMVSLMYQEIYSNRELYTRLPSCSEMLIALEDADRLLKRANAPQHIIYHTIVKNMFKVEDDIKTFESKIVSNNNSKLSSLIKSMKGNNKSNKNVDLNELISKNVLSSEAKKLTSKTEEMQRLIDTYKLRFEQMEKDRKAVIEQEVKNILLQSGKIVRTSSPNTASMFQDESANIKRGFNIFDISNSDWIDLGYVDLPDLPESLLIDTLIQKVSHLGITIYENGILLKEDNDLKLILIKNYDSDGKLNYKFMSNHPVIPSIYLTDIENFINFTNQVFDSKPVNTLKSVGNDVLNISRGTYQINALVYNDSSIDFDKVYENVYNVNLNGSIKKDTNVDFNIDTKCKNLSNVIKVSDEIISRKKVLVNE